VESTPGGKGEEEEEGDIEKGAARKKGEFFNT